MKRQKRIFKGFIHSMLVHFEQKGVGYDVINEFIEKISPEIDYDF